MSKDKRPDESAVEVRPGVSATVIGGTRYEIASKYHIIKSIGQGAYGVVVYVAPLTPALCVCCLCVNVCMRVFVCVLRGQFRGRRYER